MEVFNDTGFVFGAFAGRLRPPAFSLTVMVKATFDLVAGDVVQPAPAAEQQPLSGDLHEEDDPARGLRYPSDFVPFKPRADVLFVGTCHPRGGEAVNASSVTLEVADWRKRITVSGDRHWRAAGPTWERSEAALFTSMPLGWERSYGGASFAANPVGVGAAALRTSAGAYKPLPNLERPGRPLVSPDDEGEAVGFGPIARTWAQRASLSLGTYDDVWLRDRWPGLPVDFDLSYFNAAPRDQQLAAIGGGELVALENAHPEHRRFETRLPSDRVRCFVRRGPNESDVEEVPLRIDTLWIDGDAGKLVLVWRGVAASNARRCTDLTTALVVAEEAAGPRLPLEHYQKQVHWTRPESEAPRRPLPREDAPDEAPAQSQVDEETAAGLAIARDMLQKAGVPKDVLERLARINRGDEFLTVLLGELRHDPEASARVEKESRERTKAMLVAHGHDPSLLDEPAPPVRVELTRDEVIRRARAGESFEGETLIGLDLSALDLRGVVFTGADLSSCNLSGSRLDDADFVGAKLGRARLESASLQRVLAAGAVFFEAALDGADLTDASLSGAGFRAARMERAKLVRADLTDASFAKAHLAMADLEDADAAGANFSGAVLDGAKAKRANLAKARLTEASARDAVFDRADLSGADLVESHFERASLVEASLYGARADRADFSDAILTKVCASEGASFVAARFVGARARGATFANAVVREASFERADLSGGDLSGADAEGASFHRAVLERSTAFGTRLRTSILTCVNLFKSSLEAADLTDADCRWSNLYGCELLDAVLTRTKLDGTNLKATKLVRVG